MFMNDPTGLYRGGFVVGDITQGPFAMNPWGYNPYAAGEIYNPGFAMHYNRIPQAVVPPQYGNCGAIATTPTWNPMYAPNLPFTGQTQQYCNWLPNWLTNWAPNTLGYGYAFHPYATPIWNNPMGYPSTICR